MLSNIGPVQLLIVLVIVLAIFGTNYLELLGYMPGRETSRPDLWQHPAGLTGLEWAVGVPGSIGGAVRMNAGGHGSDVAASLLGVRVVDLARGEDDVRGDAAGRGVGVEMLVYEGEILFAFQHARIHETVEWGSSYRRSVAVSPDLLEAARSYWQGQGRPAGFQRLQGRIHLTEAREVERFRPDRAATRTIRERVQPAA